MVPLIGTWVVQVLIGPDWAYAQIPTKTEAQWMVNELSNLRVYVNKLNTSLIMILNVINQMLQVSFFFYVQITKL